MRPFLVTVTGAGVYGGASFLVGEAVVRPATLSSFRLSEVSSVDRNAIECCLTLQYRVCTNWLDVA